VVNIPKKDIIRIVLTGVFLIIMGIIFSWNIYHIGVIYLFELTFESILVILRIFLRKENMTVDFIYNGKHESYSVRSIKGFFSLILAYFVYLIGVALLLVFPGIFKNILSIQDIYNSWPGFLVILIFKLYDFIRMIKKSRKLSKYEAHPMTHFIPYVMFLIFMSIFINNYSNLTLVICLIVAMQCGEYLVLMSRKNINSKNIKK